MMRQLACRNSGSGRCLRSGLATSLEERRRSYSARTFRSAQRVQQANVILRMQIDSINDDICLADCGMVYVFVCFLTVIALSRLSSRTSRLGVSFVPGWPSLAMAAVIVELGAFLRIVHLRRSEIVEGKRRRVELRKSVDGCWRHERSERYSGLHLRYGEADCVVYGTTAQGPLWNATSRTREPATTVRLGMCT